MTSGWDLAADSPLLAVAADRPRRARFSLPVPAPTEPPDHVGRLLAGAAEVDITPPPGLPKAGYSRNAHTGTGFRSRLRARVLHLRSGTGSIALVQCDLLGGSAVLQRLVARAVADRTDVPAAGVSIGATHTHGGPGQFLGTDFYNRFASNKPGFDAAWAQQLAERIAGGVVDAVDRRVPASLAWGTDEVWGLTRNRSLPSFVRNEGADPRRGRQRAYVSVNPDLHLLRVDAEAHDGGTEPMAAMVVFSVHGTGVPMRSPTYNADLWAYVTDELAHRVDRTHGRRPVVGAVEGTHADVAPAVHPGTAGHLEARRLGRAIGERAAELYATLDGRLAGGDVPIGCGLREVDLDRDRTAGGVTLPRRPAVGAALVAGAYENETPVIHRVPPFRPGVPRRHADRPQGGKRVLGGPFQRLILPLSRFPRVLPVQVVRVGDAMLVGLPFELTVETGRRIADAVTRAVGAASSGSGTAGAAVFVGPASVESAGRGSAVTGRSGPGSSGCASGSGASGSGLSGSAVGSGSSDIGRSAVSRVVVSSVANEYAGYCTTPEEYEEQRYEGGHTLYGPGTQAFVAAHAARLAVEVARDGLVDGLLRDRAFDLHHRPYLPTGAVAPVERRIAGPATFTDATATTDPMWEQTWTDVAPGGLVWDAPLVWVEMADGHGDWRPAVAHGRPVDDQGTDLEVVHLGPDGAPDRHRYAARWWDPGFRAGRRHRFVLLAAGDRPEVTGEGVD